jgi:hypothetical protein
VSSNPNLGIMRKFRRETHELIMRGVHLSAEEVAKQEADVAHVSGARESRLALLGSRIVRSHVHVAQVHWFIENEPWTSLGLQGVVTLEAGPPRERAIALWRRALGVYADDPRVIENAVWFFGMVDPASGVEVVEGHCNRHPQDPDAWELAAVYFDFLANSLPDQAKTWALRSLEAAFRVFREEPEPLKRLPLLATMRPVASKAGEVVLLRFLDLADSAHEAARGADNRTARQLLSIAAGFVSLADTDEDRALRHLVDAAEEAAASEPMHALVCELAQRGRRDEVLSLLQLVEGRHLECSIQLRAWINQL